MLLMPQRRSLFFSFTDVVYSKLYPYAVNRTCWNMRRRGYVVQMSYSKIKRLSALKDSGKTIEAFASTCNSVRIYSKFKELLS